MNYPKLIGIALILALPGAMILGACALIVVRLRR